MNGETEDYYLSLVLITLIFTNLSLQLFPDQADHQDIDNYQAGLVDHPQP
jgi:hypothetical protein